MFRVLLLIQEGLTFDMLSEEQQAAINSVFGQYVMPMPGTVPYDGFVICDAITSGDFNPDLMAPLGITWPIISMSTFEGEIVIPLDETIFAAHMPDGLMPGPELHNWCGWPYLIQS